MKSRNVIELLPINKWKFVIIKVYGFSIVRECLDFKPNANYYQVSNFLGWIRWPDECGNSVRNSCCCPSLSCQHVHFSGEKCCLCLVFLSSLQSNFFSRCKRQCPCDCIFFRIEITVNVFLFFKLFCDFRVGIKKHTRSRANFAQCSSYWINAVAKIVNHFQR